MMASASLRGVAVVVLAVALLLPGCGSGSNSTNGSTERKEASPSGTSAPEFPHGVGPGAPISKIIVARRTGPWHGRPLGLESNGSKGCAEQEGRRAEIGLYTDVPEPTCVRVTERQRVLIVNRTGAYRRSEGHVTVVGLGPYSARLLPQQAVLFGPVGRFLGRGLHQATIDGSGRVGVLVLPKDCAIARFEPGEALCFRKDRLARRRRFAREQSRLSAQAPRCRDSDLVVWKAAGHSGVAAGTVYDQLTITNLSDRACTLSGVPALVAIDQDGRRIEKARAVPELKPTGRNPRRVITLRRTGGSAEFELTHYDGIGAGRCKFALTYGLRVKLPGARSARTVPFPLDYCPSPRGGLGLRVGRIE
jgi:hypothetical protein